MLLSVHGRSCCGHLGLPWRLHQTFSLRLAASALACVCSLTRLNKRAVRPAAAMGGPAASILCMSQPLPLPPPAVSSVPWTTFQGKGYLWNGFCLKIWDIVDLQCCVNFCYTAKCLSYEQIYALSHSLFHYGLSQDIEYSALWYTVRYCFYQFCI